MIPKILATILLLGIFAQNAIAIDEAVVSFGSLGKVHVGITPGQLSLLLPNPVERDRPYEDEEQCYYLIGKSEKTPGQVYFMITDGAVSRIDILEPGIYTSEGIQVGDTEERVKAVYKNIIIEPHHYVAPDGNYLTVNNTGGTLAIRFETYEGKVTSYYTGKHPEVEYVEGCE